MTHHATRLTGLMIGLLMLLSGCAPGAGQLIASPQFRLIREGSGLQRLDPPGVGPAQAVFRFNLEVTNPNPIGLRLAGLEFDLYVNDRRSVRSQFTDGLTLTAQGSSRLTLDVTVPVREGLELMADLIRLIAGEPTGYRLEGTVTVDILGAAQPLPRATLVAGTLTQPLRLVAPEIRFEPGRSGLREVGINRAVIDIGLDIDNPGILGYVLRAPDLTLNLGGASIAQGELVSEPIPALGRAPLTVRFEANPARIATQLATLGAGGSLQVSVSGGLELEVPGITSERFSVAALASGVLR